MPNSTQQRRLSDVMASSLAVRSRADFHAWASQDVRAYFPYQTLLCCVGRLGPAGAREDQVLGIDFPLDYLAALKGPSGDIQSPLLARWLKSFRPQLFQPENSHSDVPLEWLRRFRHYNLRNLAAHGVPDPFQRTGSYFSFSGIPGELNQHHALALDMLVPVMHQALVRVLAQETVPAPTDSLMENALSERECEILGHLAAGKSCAQIAEGLARSRHTVKTHLRNIFTKLGVDNRVQAIAKALALGLVPEGLGDRQMRSPSHGLV